MSEQLYRKIPSNHAPRSVGPRQLQEMMAWTYVPVEAYQKHEVCICLMSEGFEPEPPQKIHNSWCTYVEDEK